MRLLSKLKFPLLVILVVSLSGIFWQHLAQAANPNQIYLTPAAPSVLNGNNVTLNLRILPSSPVDTAQATINFDKTKLQFISIDSGSSAFATQLQQSVGATSITVVRVRDPGAGATSSDSLITSVVFKALVGSGSSSVTLSGANATSGGNYTNPTVGNATVNFTSPPPPAPAPNPAPITPPPGTGNPSSGSSGNPNTGNQPKGSSPKTPSNSSNSTTATTTNQTDTTTAVPVVGAKITTQKPKVYFSEATIPLTTSEPTQAYAIYGTSKSSLGTTTAVSDFSTTHQLSLDPSRLVPGTTYYYQLVTTSKSGAITKSAISSIKTTGLTVRTLVTDKNFKPLRNASVTLHSTPITVKTNDKGVAVFSDVSPGEHHLVYGKGKHAVTEAVTVANTVQGSGATQTAPLQNLAVVMSVATPTSHTQPIVTALLILVIAAAVIYFRRQIPRLVALIIPTSPTLADTPHIIAATSPAAAPQKINVLDSSPVSLDEDLNHVSGNQTPSVGSTIMPQPNDVPGDKK